MVAGGTMMARDANSQMIFRAPDTEYGLLHDWDLGVSGQRIVWIAPAANRQTFSEVNIIVGDGKLLTPGLIDCHTHLVYGGNRAGEWESRLKGVSYEDLARQGGGILSTVAATRLASLDELVASASRRLQRLTAEGVTTVEIKSGYGLNLETEMKMLRAARQLSELFPVSIETTLLAAHAIPPEYHGRANEYVDVVCQEVIPACAEMCSAVDVFCESIAFDVPQTLRVFEAAKAQGLNFKVHAEQLSRTGIAAVAAEMGALSADHLEFLSEADCRTLGLHTTVATLLPGAFYCLNEMQKPPVPSLRRHGVPIAVATDSNPGSSPVTSILLAANMACNLFRLTPAEALAAVTINAARALGIADQIGSLQPGRYADFAVWEVQSPAEIVYGVGHNPCVAVYRRGEPVL
jgi:imidazolonepropionase